MAPTMSIANQVIYNYERKRNEKVKRNNEVLNSLGLKSIATSLWGSAQHKRANDNGKHSKDELDDDYRPPDDGNVNAYDSDIDLSLPKRSKSESSPSALPTPLPSASQPSRPQPQPVQPQIVQPQHGQRQLIQPQPAQRLPIQPQPIQPQPTEPQLAQPQPAQPQEQDNFELGDNIDDEIFNEVEVGIRGMSSNMQILFLIGIQLMDRRKKEEVGVSRTMLYEPTHTKKDGKTTVRDKAAENMRKMKDSMASQQSTPEENTKGKINWSKNDIYSQVIDEKEHSGHFRGLGFGHISKTCGSTSTSDARLRVASNEERMREKDNYVVVLEDKLNSAVSELNTVKSVVEFLARQSCYQVKANDLLLLIRCCRPSTIVGIIQIGLKQLGFAQFEGCPSSAACV
ncbi:hypothetical protein RHSIM_Rhsim05G0119300 [Rhododendron simsii]|uniref:Uncharacterized protein n=1 Tax=Rhododendron simsii TaxID=118357 RepID=A0A834GY91_RHOSS|nr:hypothetical protein RHSIM_Rhsim05G0119300 [Rhododendron simsii]